MKKTFKKLSAALMAFALLGTGTFVTKKLAPQSDNTLVASAASCGNCQSSYHYSESAVSKTINGITVTYVFCHCSRCGYSDMYIIY
ncbi:hypothetical protein [Ruminococcus flavefaciens]|uniref:Lipoprotein n=1 Tax=Ruminococcus flavefaciens 007c TaxID=1341157 RepID=W7ULH6_RUMFL|nr:hypothetical protein [Ruminococcus flavefaciens]EWM52444.1 hypothetical protein RF007C_07865 [Ruminococcus flavefaciens 007c]